MSNENQGLQLASAQSSEITFGNAQQFEHAQRVAKMLSASILIPKEYQNNIPNTMIALEMANRVGASPLMVMQNLYIVHGKPSWSGSFTIAALNSCGRFTPIRFEMDGSGDSLKCRAYANDKKTSERLNGSWVTMAMAKGEGWIDKQGSKWKTMPEQMIQYRAGAFFGRLYAPDVLMGMPMADEVEDYTALMTWEQENKIHELMNTSTLSEERKGVLISRMNSGISEDVANDILKELRMNQQDPLTERGSASAKEIKEGIKKII